LPRIEAQVLARARWLHDRLSADARFELISDSPPNSGIVTFRVRDMAAQQIVRALRSENIVCAARGGGVRFSPHFYTPLARLERAWAVLNRVAA